jgi:hypothetical protein
MSLKNQLLYQYRSYFIRKSWEKRFERTRKALANFEFPNKEKLKFHQNYWKDFSKNYYADTLTIVHNTASMYNINIVPEEIYAIEIEPTLNQHTLTLFLENKSVLDYWFKGNYLPKAILHRIDGVYFDGSFKIIKAKEITNFLNQIEMPVLFKPNKDSFGGQGVQILSELVQLNSVIEKKENFIIQEVAQQHEFFSSFNSHGLNTIRVCCYRSVQSNEWCFLNASLRMGVGGSLDNLTAGGIVAYINKLGCLNGLARDKYGVPFTTHPDNAKKFIDKIPFYENLIATSLDIANHVFYARVISLDMYLDQNNKWRCLEVNLKGQTTRFAQYAGVPFFGEFTDEVKEYCMKNHWKDK